MVTVVVHATAGTDEDLNLTGMLHPVGDRERNAVGDEEGLADACHKIPR